MPSCTFDTGVETADVSEWTKLQQLNYQKVGRHIYAESNESYIFYDHYFEEYARNILSDVGILIDIRYLKGLGT